MPSRRFVGPMGAVLAAIGVALSAYAAHAAAGDARTRLYTAAVFALAHGIALACMSSTMPRALGGIALSGMLAGALLFSGSLVAAHFLGWPPRLAPFGGVVLIVSWLLVAVEKARR